MRRGGIGPCSLALVLIGVASAAAAATATQDARPKTLPDLVAAFDHTFRQILTSEEYVTYQTTPAEEIAETSPELYQKVSQNIHRWSDDWIKSVTPQLATVPDRRLVEAEAATKRIESILARYFEARGWPYRPMRVVYLPQRLFHVPSRIARDPLSPFGFMDIKGMFIPFYPEVFFTTVQPSTPLGLVIVHESLHFNSRDRRFGHRLSEGITDVGARHIASEHGEVDERELRAFESYPTERDLVETILRGIVERTGRSREDAVDALLGTYITGSHVTMHEIFGAEAWQRIVELSRNHETWHQFERGVQEALGE